MLRFDKHPVTKKGHSELYQIIYQVHERLIAGIPTVVKNEEYGILAILADEMSNRIFAAVWLSLKVSILCRPSPTTLSHQMNT